MQHKEIEMTHQYFSHKHGNPLEKQMQELIELNMKTLQNFSYLNPTELLTTLKPEAVLEKQMNVFIQNSRKTMDYMRDMFNLMEKNWLNLSDTVTQNTKELMSQAQTVAQHSMKEAMSEGQRIAKKAASTTKSVAKKSVKKAGSATRKNIKSAAKTMKQATKTATKMATKTASATLKGAAKSTVTKAKPKTTKSTAAKSTAPKKPEIRPMSTSAAQKTSTMSKMESKIHDTRQVNPLTVPSVTNDATKKDRPLM